MTEVKLGLTQERFENIFGNRTFGVLKDNSIENIRADWNVLQQLPQKWERLLPPILELASNEKKVKSHFHLVGMGVEMLRIYFLALSLAEADNVNVARSLLRSCLDALAYGTLLDRLPKEGQLDFGDTPRLEKLVQKQHNRIAYKIRVERKQTKHNRTPFSYLLYHLKDYDLKEPPIEPEKIEMIDALKFYSNLSGSVHEDASSTDAFALRPRAKWLLSLWPKFAKDSVVRHLFPDFASGAMRTGLKGAMREVLSQRRREFITNYSEATDILSEVIRLELDRIRHEPVK
jgi:hypothetical protein